MSEKTRHGAEDPSHPHPGTRMPKVPDKTTLGLATVLAVFIASCLLLLFVLPAEYGIDPTHFGEITGVSRLHATSNEVSLGDRVGSVVHPEATAPRNDTVVITLNGLGDDLEYKFHLVANQSFLYSWTANGPVEYDFHGEPDQPARPGDFTSYEAKQRNDASGSFQAPFTGRHGWYWRSYQEAPVTITLHTWGYYDIVGRI
jgi:hypothetical protein